jgi:rhodanese-related sulfurtransferase
MDALRITAQEVSRRIDEGDKVFFVDSRGQQSWNESDERLPGAVRIPVDMVEDRANSNLPGDALIVTYCT